MSTPTEFITKLYINNEFVDAKSGATFDTINPNNKQKIASVAHAQAEDVDLAVKAAVAAFPSWSRSVPINRQRIMFKIAELLEEECEAFAALEALDSGKPVAACRAADIPLTANTFRYYGGLATSLVGEHIPLSACPDGAFLAYTRREAVGVVGAIIPWNFPLAMLAWKLGPALAAGCTVVLKPSEKTPLSALKFAELTRRAGLPAGVLNVVTGYGNPTGSALSLHPQIDKVAFTGSTRTGRMIQRAVIDAEGHLRRISLELGGKSPLIVLPDADIKKAVETANHGLFFNCGQCCIASSRVYVHESIYDAFCAEAAAQASKRTLGDQMSEETVIGPIVDDIQFNQVMRYIGEGKKDGAVVVTGGEADESKGGYHVKPTIFRDVTPNMTICKEEIFGPVMSVLKYSTLSEVIAMANDTPYGLGAGVCGKDSAKAHFLATRLRAGTIYINCWDIFDPAAPFGGFKDSGIGRELGTAAMNLYTEVKTVIASLDFDGKDELL